MTTCFQPIFGKRVRLTRLDLCGNPPPAGEECAYVATDGFVTLTLSSEIEDGTEIITRKASGALCVNEKASDSFKRFTLEMEFCGVNPDLLGIATNAEPYFNWSGESAGVTVPEGDLDGRFALELWTGLTGAACEPGAEEASGYLLLPFVNAGVIGDLEVGGEDAVTFSMTGAFTRGGNQWGTGPYAVADRDGEAVGLPQALDPLDHLLLMMTNVAPPPEACDCQPMPEEPIAVPAPELTGVNPDSGPTDGGNTVTLTGTGFEENPDA